jgi:hypothetical protein
LLVTKALYSFSLVWLTITSSTYIPTLLTSRKVVPGLVLHRLEGVLNPRRICSGSLDMGLGNSYSCDGGDSRWPRAPSRMAGHRLPCVITRRRCRIWKRCRWLGSFGLRDSYDSINDTGYRDLLMRIREIKGASETLQIWRGRPRMTWAPSASGCASYSDREACFWYPTGMTRRT